MTNREYLNGIVDYLNKATNRKYQVKILVLDINYRAVGSLGTITREEGIIAIVSNDFDKSVLNENIIGEPEYFKDFYETGKFIYCFGPYEKTLDLLKVLDDEANIECFYGFENYFDDFISKKGFTKTLKITNNVWYE